MTEPTTTRAEGPSATAAAVPAVSVVIVNYNGRRHLERCLPSLARTAGVAIETIVVDNGSTDGSVEWLATNHPEVRLLPQAKNLGFGEANRRGIAAASHELVALLNNDTVVDPGWLMALIEPLEREPAVAATCSALRLLDHPGVVNANGGGMTWLAYGFDLDFGFPVDEEPTWRTREVLFPTAAAMLMRRRDFLSIGGFDRSFFMYHEDVDLGWRWWISGKRVLVCADSIVYHAFGGTTKSLGGLRWREMMGARHALRSVLKNYELTKMARVLWALAKVWWRRRAFGTALHAVAWNLLHLPGTTWQRFRVWRSRRVTDMELLTRVISPAAVPPAAPELPRAHDARDASRWIEIPSLLPGQQSAQGRLGRGWYAEEVLHGARMRFTSGRAECFLKVPRGVAGTVVVTATHPVPDPRTRELTVTCNGSSRGTGRLPESGWGDVAIAVPTGHDGVIELELRSPAPVSHAARANWDFRSLGAGIREIRFVPAEAPARPREPRVSVIVPTYNRWPILEMTLEALVAQDYRNFEVVVVDDGSTDNTWARLGTYRDGVAGRLDLKIVHQENLKPGRARNNGLKHATGELILFLGDDIIPAPDLVREHVAKHVSMGEPVGVLGFTDWDRKGMRVTPFLDFVNQDGQQFCYGHFADGDDLFFTGLYTSNISLPAAVLGTEPFHPAFTFVDWEDIELGYRLSLAGLRLVLHTRATGRHLHPMSVASFWRRQVHVGRTVGVLLALHPELAASPIMPPLVPRRWYFLARPLAPLTRVVVGWLDSLGIPLPAKVYRGLLLVAFWNGRRLPPLAAAG